MGKFCSIKYISHSKYPKDNKKLSVIRINPGMAFGTGLHPTTQMCLQLISSVPLSNKNVIDLGCGSGILGIACAKKGAKSVTMIIREKEIGKNIKYWVRPDIINRIENNEINVFYESIITEIKDKSIIINNKEGNIEIDNDFVLAMTGYQPNYEILENLGIEIQKDEFKTPFYNEETMETNIKGVFLAGVICGGLKTNKWFIENSRDHSEKIISQITKT